MLLKVLVYPADELDFNFDYINGNYYDCDYNSETRTGWVEFRTDSNGYVESYINLSIVADNNCWCKWNIKS